MTIVLLILAWLLMLIGLLGTLLPVLPGTILIWLGALLYAWATNFQQVDGWLLLLLAGMVVLAEALGYVSSAAGARGFGASNWGMVGAFVGGLVGLLVLGPVGILIGPFVGATIAECASGQDFRGALRAGVGSGIGALGGVLAHFLAGLVMIGVVVMRVL